MNESPPAGSRATVITGVGPYPPLFYLLVGVPARLAGAAVEGLYAARLAALVITWALLVVAWWAARDFWTRVAIVLSTTPMVVFLGSSVTVSGIEIAAAIAFASISARVARGPADRWLWMAFAVSGVALASARILGPAWIVFDIALLGVALGPRVLVARLTSSRPAVVSLAVVAGAWLLTVVWDIVAAPQTPSSVGDAIRSIPATVALVPVLLDQTVGVFGWLDTFLPPWVTWLVVGLQVLLLGLAVAVGSWRDRAAICLGMIGVFILLVMVDGLTQIPTGFRVQARYLMPVTTMFLVFGGSIVGMRSFRSSRVRSVASFSAWGAVACSLLTHPLAWYINSHRSAVGTLGPVMFFGAAEWSPPGSWWLWAGVALVGFCAAVVGVSATLVPPRTGAALPRAERTPPSPAVREHRT